MLGVKSVGHYLQAEPHVDGTFLLVNGDNVFAVSVAPAIAAVAEADAVLAVEEVSPEVAATNGVIETDEAGCVTGLVEKPAEPSLTLVTTGCYMLHRVRGDNAVRFDATVVLAASILTNKIINSVG